MRTSLAPQPRAVRVNIIGKANGAGLARDIDLLAGALQACGHEVGVTIIDAVQAKRRRYAVLTRLVSRSRLGWGAKRALAAADINLMLEHVWPQYLSTALVNVAVPNPEWFDWHDLHFLPEVDTVWAKTGYTGEVFRALGCATTFIGFDSDDRYDAAIPKQSTYFHLAGKSNMKGTDRLLSVWQRHPEWPCLILLHHKRGARELPSAPNIDARVEYLSDAELRRLQNESRFHLCLSLTEGWGHYIAEAMGVGAVTIAVDARPMNELVDPSRGILVPYRATGTQRLATTYQFDDTGLEAAIERTLAMSDEECAQLGERARAWFIHNKSGFGSRIEAALRETRRVASAQRT
jgi:hypothetical protein